ncbi:MAG: glycoside hydrolase family 30 beta sandwich domain-containing protein [Acidimicrobiales bacterium]|jgi:glucosylceramidase
MRRTRVRYILSVMTGLLLLSAGLTTVALGGFQTVASAATPPTTKAPFNECPAIGEDTSCGLLIDITKSGIEVLGDPTQSPFDGTDDTLVGVLNQSSAAVSDIPLSSSTADVFDFDGDGICSGDYGTWSAAPASSTVSGDAGSANCPYNSDTTTYAGPDTSMSGISADDMSGTVDFPTPLATGQSTYFSLESAISTTPPINLQVAVVDVDLTNGNSADYSAPFSQSTLTPGPVSSGTFTLDPAVTRQTIDGFGATLTNSSAAVLMSLPSATLHSVLNTLFNPNDAGISVIRLPMGANDFSANGCSAGDWFCNSNAANYTYDDMPQPDSSNPYCRHNTTDPTLECFSILPYDQDIVDILQYVEQNINPHLTIIASPWTAPPWMKTNLSCRSFLDRLLGNDSCTYTAIGDGTLNPVNHYQYYSTYAQYFVKYIEQLQAAVPGLTVNYVTPQNEPGNVTQTYPGMFFSPSQEAFFVDQYLAPALSGAHLSSQILGYDWNWSGSWTDSQIDGLLSGAPSNVAGTAWHCYGGSPSTQSTIETAYGYPRFLAFITECSGHGPDNTYGPPSARIPGESHPVSNFAYNLYWDSQYLIIGGLSNWASGVQLFNLALNQFDGPQNGGCNDCRGIVTVATNTHAVHQNVDYYLLTEASNAFEQGAKIICTTTSVCTMTSDGLQAVGGINPDGTTGLYVSNPTGNNVPFTVDDQGEGFAYTIPANSVASFRWDN